MNVLRNHLLDAGSTAKVYEGRFGKERVAVKLCRLRTLNQKSVADFVREARTLAAFSHPNVMRLVGCCPVPPHFMIVSEYCSGAILPKCCTARILSLTVCFSLGVCFKDFAASLQISLFLSRSTHKQISVAEAFILGIRSRKGNCSCAFQRIPWRYQAGQFYCYRGMDS